MATNLIKLKSSKGDVILTDEMIIKNTDEFIQGINLPESYNYLGAIKSFCLALPDVKGIENATARSVYMAAQDYVNRHLDISKNQCALIMYNDTLKLQKQYQGNVALAKKSNPHIVDITSSAIYQGDEIEITKVDGRTEIKHTTKFENMNNNVVGAYATVIYDDGKTDNEIMTRQGLEMSWSMSKAGTTVHKKFPSQMARKTVLNRLCLSIINSSIDSESPDFVKDEVEQYEEGENQNTNPNIDYEHAISMDDFVEEVKDEPQVEVKPIVEEKASIIEPIKEEVNDSEVDGVLARFETIKQEDKKEEINLKDGKHCEICGKELSETNVNYYDKHPELARLCYSCNKKEGNI